MAKYKQIDFQSEELVKAIQLYADENTEGNFNLAVRQLCKNGVGFNKKCRSRCPVGK
jgi:hypothetical protein